MSKISVFFFVLCIAAVHAANSRYPADVVPLSSDFAFFQAKGKGEQFWKLSAGFRAQKTGSSCSVASLTTVINAIIPSVKQSPDKEIISEKELLSLNKSELWSKNTGNGGKGMTLKELHAESAKVLKNLKLDKQYRSEFFEMKNDVDKKNFYRHLESFEKGEGFLILMFGQGMIMGGKEQYPHYSPVGAYDQLSDRMLMLDVDGDWYEPYWVPIKKMVTSLNMYDEEMKCQRGYLWISKLGK